MTTHTIALRDERLHLPLLAQVCFAAAPTFATMALLAGVFGGGPRDTLCSRKMHHRSVEWSGCAC
jgi:hypothetical protein